MTPAEHQPIDMEFRRLRPQNFEVSWAGEAPSGMGICLGSEDGRILFSNMEADRQWKPTPIINSGEPVNGFAFTRSLFGITSRDEVVIAQRPNSSVERGRAFHFDFGAHGIAATPSGRLVAPMGRGRLHVVAAELQGAWSRFIETQKDTIYFYAARPVEHITTQDVVFCALRRGGVAWIELDDREQMHIRSTNNSDIVDICPIGNASSPYAAAFLGLSGSLYLTDDLRADGPLWTIAPANPIGNGYRVLRSEGSLVLLTSERLVVLPGVIDRFLQTGGLADRSPSFDIREQYVDLNVYRQQYLLLVTPDGHAEVHDLHGLLSFYRMTTDDLHPALSARHFSLRASAEHVSIPDFSSSHAVDDARHSTWSTENSWSTFNDSQSSWSTPTAVATSSYAVAG